MSNALLFGLPVLVLVVLIALIYRKPGTRNAPYRLPQPWTHGPILWSAIAEPIPVSRHGFDGQGVHDFVGGGASGRW